MMAGAHASHAVYGEEIPTALGADTPVEQEVTEPEEEGYEE